MGLLDYLRAPLGWRDRKKNAGRNRRDGLPDGERRRRVRTNPRPGTQFLVIDDSPTACALLSQMLVSAGYRAWVASDAERGLKIAQRMQPDLIFLDVILPGMNGFAALHALGRDRRTRAIPVVLMSSAGDSLVQIYDTTVAADAFMHKPFTRRDVFGHIEALLDANGVPRCRRHTD